MRSLRRGPATSTQTYIVTGGTGLFASADPWNILWRGTLTFIPGTLPFDNVNVNGTITAPCLTALPERAMMLIFSTGLAGVGAVVRKKRKARSSDRV
jgi:hypothetical protein